MNLINLNLTAAYLHCISALAIALIFYIRNKPFNMNTDLYRFKLTGLGGENDDEIELESEKKFTVSNHSIEIVLVLIFVITSLFHFFYFSDNFKNKTYLSEIEKGYNRFRWLEYGITATMMIFILNIISGVFDFDSVFLLCALTAFLMSMGYFLETSTKQETKYVALFLGFSVLLCIFGIIFENFFYRIDEAKKLGRDLPDWLYGVLLPMLFWYASFGVVAAVNVFNQKNAGYSYITYEKWYIYLSFLSKAFMGYYLAIALTREKSKEK